MALKILTGILRPNPAHLREGRARIFFNSHHATEDAMATETIETGAEGDFTARPGQLVAVRDFVIEDRDTFWGRSESDWFRVDIEEWTADHLAVSWRCEPGAAIREISYMIVGEVAEVDPRVVAAGEVVLANGGIPQMEIKVLADSHERAATELQTYLNKLVAPESFDIITSPTEELDGPAIYLGDPTLVGISPSDLGSDDFVVAAKPHTSGANDLVIAGGSELAAFYGVTAVLESLGFGWYFSNEEGFDESTSFEPGLGEKWPELSNPLVLSPPLPRSGLAHRPSFRIRGVRGVKAEDDHLRKWGRRNFQNVERRAYDPEEDPEGSRYVPERIPGEFGVNRLSHSWNLLVPRKYWDPGHPDYTYLDEIFELRIIRNEVGEEIRRVRCNPWDEESECPNTGRHSTNLCPGSERTADVLAEGIRELLCHVPNLKHVVLWPEDVGFNCACEHCAALDETDDGADQTHQLNSKRVFTLTNRVAEQIADTHPDVTLIAPAYGSFLAPPIDESLAPAPNVRIIYARPAEHNHAFDDPFSTLNWEVYYHYYRQWLERLDGDPEKMLLYEYYNKAMWLGLPWPIVHILKRDISRFQDDRLLGLWSQYSQNFASNGLVYYIAARLLWDAEADVEVLKEQYCNELFGNAGPHMLAYYNQLEEASVGSGLEFVGTLKSSAYWEIVRLFSPELCTELDVHLTAANDPEELVLSPKELERVQGMQAGLEFTRLMVCWIHGMWYYGPWKFTNYGVDSRQLDPISFDDFLNMEVKWFKDLVKVLFSEEVDGEREMALPDCEGILHTSCIEEGETREEAVDSECPLRYCHLWHRLKCLLEHKKPWIAFQEDIGYLLNIRKTTEEDEEGEGDFIERTDNKWVREWKKLNRTPHYPATKPEWFELHREASPVPVTLPAGSNLNLWIYGREFDPGESTVEIYEVGSPVPGWRGELLPLGASGHGEVQRLERAAIILNGINIDAIGEGPWEVQISNPTGDDRVSAIIYGVWLLPDEGDDVTINPENIGGWTTEVETNLESIRERAVAFREFCYYGIKVGDTEMPANTKCLDGIPGHEISRPSDHPSTGFSFQLGRE